jgi:hypothetical protein
MERRSYIPQEVIQTAGAVESSVHRSQAEPRRGRDRAHPPVSVGVSPAYGLADMS